MKANQLGKIGIIGGTGWIGSAFLKQMLAKKYIAPTDVWVSNRSGKKLPEWPDVNVVRDNQTLVDTCDTIILSVRPQHLPEINIQVNNQLIISVMAGVTVKRIEELTGAKRIIRSMPNAACEIGLSYTPWYASEAVDEILCRGASALFETIGQADQLTKESQVDFFTALTGSGQGWVTFFQHTLIQCGIEHGLTPKVAEHAIRQLFLGVSTLLSESHETTEELLKILVDYAGTTAAGLKVMLKSKISEDVAKAIDTSYQKAASDMTR